MRIWLSLILFPALSWGECHFRKDIGGIYSLSGPVTIGIDEAGLLKSTRLLGISSFYETKKKFHGEKIPGGSLLSPATVRGFQKGIVFFDESQETEKILKAFGSNQVLKKISTRNLTPRQVNDLVLSELRLITSGCEKELDEIDQSLVTIQKKILGKIPKSFKAVFFLGGFEGIASPDLVMANDGFVRWLRNEKKIKTYPTSLAYVPWSAKILNGPLKEAFKIGLIDAPESSCTKHGPKKFTCKFPRALTPGIDQLRALDFILDQI